MQQKNTDELALLNQQINYKAIMEHSMVAFFLTKIDGTILEVNKAACTLFAYNKEELKTLGRKGIIDHTDESIDGQLKERKENGKSKGELIGIKKNGEKFPLEYSSTLFHGADGEEFSCTTMSDITERKEAAEKIIKLNRLYAFISQVNKMIVRVTDEATLFKETCRIAVDVGKFRMAWIGLIDEESKIVVPQCQAGGGIDYLSKIKRISVADLPEGRGPVGTALREGKYIFCNDIENDPLMAPWKDAALSRGYLSAIALPIKKLGQIIGAFTLYAQTINFFNQEEIELLEATANDISFALDVFEKEKIRKLTEDKLLKSEKRYQTLAEISPVGIFHTDETGYTTYVNPSWCRISGLAYENALGNGWFDAVHKDDREILRKGWEQATKTKHISTSEYRFVKPDGSIEWVMGQAVPERNANNEIVGYVGTTTDITERKKAEETIKENEQKINLIYNTTKDALYLLSVKENRFCFDSVNQSFLTTTGLTEKKVIGKFVDEIIPAPSLAMVLNNYQSAIANKQTLYWEETSAYPSGTKTGIVSITPIYDEQGNCNMLVGSVHDITEIKKIENDIRRERHLSDSIINSLPGIFYLYNMKGEFLRWNHNFEQVSMYSADEIKTMNPLDFFNANDKDILAEKIANVFLHGEDYVQAGFLLKSKETIPYYFTGKAIEYEGNTCLLGVGIDFSERVKAQEEIKQASEKLSQLTNHLQTVIEEERKRISREIHDDLGQQLTAINMDVAWIEKKMPEEYEPIKNKLKNIRQLLNSSTLSIRRILNELRPIILENYGLNEAITWLCKKFTANTGIDVEIKDSTNNIKTSEQIANCIFRAYQEAFTNITRYANAKKVTTSISMNNGIIYVLIEDDGIGFNVSAIDTRKSFGILGMKERVHSLGGHFNFVSSVGKGTSISIELPLQPIKH